MIRNILYLAIPLFVAVSCTMTDSSSTSGITQADNFLRGTVKDEDNRPITNAEVILFTTEEYAPLAKKMESIPTQTPIDTTHTDSLGLYSFLMTNSGIYSLSVSKNDSLITESVIEYTMGDTQLFDLIAKYSANNAAQEGKTDPAPVDTFTILVEDFETHDGSIIARNAIAKSMSRTDFGEWSITKDIVEGGNSYAFPDYSTENGFSEGFTSDTVKNSTYITQDIKLGDGINEYNDAYYGIETSLAPEGKYVDFSNLETVEFYAKGNGVISVSFTTELCDSYEWGYMIYPISLSDTWQKYTLPATDFLPSAWSAAADAGITWKEGQNRIRSILFISDQEMVKAGDELTLNLDDISFSFINNSAITFKDPQGSTVLDSIKAIERTSFTTEPYDNLEKVSDPSDYTFYPSDMSPVPSQDLVSAFTYFLEELNGTVPVYVPTAGEVLVDDFENGLKFAGDENTNPDNQSSLGATFNYYTNATDMYFDAGYWFAFNDSQDGGTSVAYPDYINDKEFENGFPSSSTGNFMAMSIELGEGIDEYGTALYGVRLPFTEIGEYIDLSSLDTIEFYAAGSGSISVQFTTKLSNVFSWGNISSNEIELTTTWTKYSIPVSEMTPEKFSPTADGEITWDDSKTNVESIIFNTYIETQKAGSMVTFAIDNIILKGMNYGDFNAEHTVIANPLL